MKNLKIPLARPFIHKDYLKLAEKVIKSGFLTQGKMVERFEDELKKFLDVNYLSAVSSGSSAILLSLKAEGIGEGDEVIVPDFTFPAAANAVEIFGSKVVPADIDTMTFNISPKSMMEKITPSTKAIVAVHQFGIPAKIIEILEITKKRRIFLLEDAACGFGGKISGKLMGTLGNCGIFSFHPRKIITTGEGGCVVGEYSFIEKIKSLRNHGKWGNGFLIPGFNLRMSDINAAIGVSQIKRTFSFIKKREKLAKLYIKILKDIDEVIIPDGYYRDGQTYQSFVVLLKKNINREKIIIEMRKKGIETQIGGFALHEIPYYREKYKLREGMFPNSAFASKQSLTLPLFYSMNEKNVNEVCKCLKEILWMKK